MIGKKAVDRLPVFLRADVIFMKRADGSSRFCAMEVLIDTARTGVESVDNIRLDYVRFFREKSRRPSNRKTTQQTPRGNHGRFQQKTLKKQWASCARKLQGYVCQEQTAVQTLHTYTRLRFNIKQAAHIARFRAILEKGMLCVA